MSTPAAARLALQPVPSPAVDDAAFEAATEVMPRAVASATGPLTLRKPGVGVRWPFVYAAGELEERLGSDIPYFSAPCPGPGMYEVRGRQENAVALVWVPDGGRPQCGVVVLLSDTRNVAWAVRQCLARATI